MIPSQRPDAKSGLFLFPNVFLGALLLLQAGGLGWVALILFRVSSGSGRALLFGLSGQSLLLVSLTGLGALGIFMLGLLILGNRLSPAPWLRIVLQHPGRHIGWLATLAGITWLLAWTPAEQFGRYYYYALRLIPIASWISFSAGSFAVAVLIAWHGVQVTTLQTYLRANRSMFMVVGITLLLMGLTAWLAARYVVGMQAAEEDFWYGAGVPVLAWQVLIALVVGGATAWSEKRFFSNQAQKAKPSSAVVFALIWMIAGLWWANTPLAFNFMISPPYPPNFAPYPAADGANYDLASQYALLGQGLYNGGQMKIYFERPLYSAFLFYLHLIVGQDYAQLLSVQAFLYGVFPALAYLIGKSLHSQALGATLATLLTLRGWNGLTLGGILETSTQKMLLTDFPTAIGLALLLYLAIRWVQSPHRWTWGIWLGGVVGLGSFVRPHLLFFLPAACLLAVLLFWQRKRIGAGLASLVIAAYLGAVLPWMQFNGSGMSLLSVYLWRAQAIIRERFYWPAPGDSALPQATASLTPLPLLEETIPEKSLAAFTRDHFLNNLTLSALSLPNTLQVLTPETLVRHSETYWTPYWNGALSPSARILLPINLLLVALGIGLAWQRTRWVGLIPLFGMLFYFLINSLVRTSGGRYLVPADWVVFLYYLLGWVACFELGAAWLGQRFDSAAEQKQKESSQPHWQGLGALAAVIALGGLIPLTNLLHPPRYAAWTATQLVSKLDSRLLNEMGVTEQELLSFLEQKQAILLQGSALYPRYIRRGVNPFIPDHLLNETPYSRLSLTAIGQHGHIPVVLITGDEWFALPHTAEVLVIGCQNLGFVDAWAIVLPQQGTIHLRQPTTSLRCPLPEPVCNNNGECRYE
ncbi:MAG: hypothetical protein DDG60_10705 [Anaerolineae bacterium]|nr:MAG: hypothetical protein DDG60_10705 [Anaerolineae bacterium]